MPTTVTETDEFTSAVQRPNNGELADAASLLQGIDPLTKRTRYLYNRSIPAQVDIHRAPFNAVGSGAVNDYPAFLAARDYLVSLGGGVIRLRPGHSYRLDSTLVLEGDVHIEAHSGRLPAVATSIIRNHNGIGIQIDNRTGITTLRATHIRGLRFEDATASTPPLIDVADGSLRMQDCWLLGAASVTNGALLKVWCPGYCALEHSYLQPANAIAPILLEQGRLLVRNCNLVYPGIEFSQPFIRINSTSASVPAIARIVDNVFDGALVATGTPEGVKCEGVAVDLGLVGNRFSGSPTANLRGLVYDTTDTKILHARGNSFVQAIRYINSSASPLSGALGATSFLELDGHAYSTVNTTSIAVPNGVECFVVYNEGGAPTITMPTKYYAGQTLDLIVVNASASTWGSITLAGATPTGHASLLAGATRSLRLRVGFDGSSWGWRVMSSL